MRATKLKKLPKKARRGILWKSMNLPVPINTEVSKFLRKHSDKIDNDVLIDAVI